MWSGLNPHLLAHFFECDKDGKKIEGTHVYLAPLVDGTTIEGVPNWQSPFENAGTESKAPALAAMLQSGAIQPLITSLSGAASDLGMDTTSFDKASSGLSAFEGKTGITKLNSTQIFSGMAPIRITMTVLLKAFRDPIQEVERPYNQLWKWSLPAQLAETGTLNEIVKVARSGGSIKDYIKALMPSDAPRMIGFKYKRKLFAPMVIESISEPMDSPITQYGHYTQMLVPITLATLTALDAED